MPGSSLRLDEIPAERQHVLYQKKPVIVWMTFCEKEVSIRSNTGAFLPLAEAILQCQHESLNLGHASHQAKA